MSFQTLRSEWLSYYAAFSINEKLASGGITNTQSNYNLKLKQFLLELQESKRKPSQDMLIEVCENLMQEAQKEEVLNGDMLRFESSAIQECLMSMDFTFGVHTHGKSGKNLSTPLYRTEAIIPCESLSNKEIEFTIDFINLFCFKGRGVAEHDEHWNSIIFTILSIPMSAHLDEQNHQSIFDACTRHLLYSFNCYLAKKSMKKLPLEFGLLQRALDKRLLSKI